MKIQNILQIRPLIIQNDESIYVEAIFSVIATKSLKLQFKENKLLNSIIKRITV